MPANHNTPHTEEAKRKMSQARIGKPNLSRRRETKIVGDVVLYRCGQCGGFFPAEGFYKDKRTLLGITSACRNCHNSTSIRSRDKDNARKINREHMRRARAVSPEKFRERERKQASERGWDKKREARYQVNLAVSRGDMVKPDECQECHKKTRLTAHHADYDRPLDVVWLCYECHGKKHRDV